VGYPDHPRDYSGLAIAADDLVGNVRRAAATDLEFYVGRLGGFAQQGLLASSRAGAFSPSFFRNGKSSLDHFERSQRHRSGPLWRVDSWRKPSFALHEHLCYVLAFVE